MQKESQEKKIFDFNSLLSWFGVFTSQFKNHLILFQKTNTPSDFMALAQEIFTLFRRYLFDMSQIKSGPKRARWLHQQIDTDMKASESKEISCGKGCGHCCHVEKQITNDEAELIVDFIEKENIFFAEVELKSQADRYEQGVPWSSLIVRENRCVFLNQEDSCDIYSVRPTVCRKHRVFSSPTECQKGPEGIIEADAQLIPEILTSAALSLPGNESGPMPVQILDRLNSLNQKDSADPANH